MQVVYFLGCEWVTLSQDLSSLALPYPPNVDPTQLRRRLASVEPLGAPFAGAAARRLAAGVGGTNVSLASPPVPYLDNRTSTALVAIP